MRFSFASRAVALTIAFSISLLDLRPAHAEPPPTAPPASRVERNSLAMTITGLSLSAIGFVGVGVGTGLVLYGNRQCAESAGAIAAPLYLAADDYCRSSSDLVTGGIGTLVGGGVLMVSGLALTIAGSWKVTVGAPSGAATRTVPGSLTLTGTF